MDAILLQLLNGLDKGGAYALIALGLTLVFGTLGVVNFAHGALFMLGAFCAVTMNKILTLQQVALHPTLTDPLGNAARNQHALYRNLSWRRRQDHGRLFGAAFDSAGDPGDGSDRLHHGTRPDPAFLRPPPRRPNPGHVRAGHRHPGNRPGVFRRQFDSPVSSRNRCRQHQHRRDLRYGHR